MTGTGIGKSEKSATVIPKRDRRRGPGRECLPNFKSQFLTWKFTCENRVWHNLKYQHNHYTSFQDVTWFLLTSMQLLKCERYPQHNYYVESEDGKN